MSGRPATVTQAEVARMIRAAKQAGLPIVRVKVTADGVSLETDLAPSPKSPAETGEAKKQIVL